MLTFMVTEGTFQVSLELSCNHGYQGNVTPLAQQKLYIPAHLGSLDASAVLTDLFYLCKMWPCQTDLTITHPLKHECFEFLQVRKPTINLWVSEVNVFYYIPGLYVKIFF